MDNLSKENKVVEYEIITTKKFRQVVKVQFDEKYSDKLDETKITPSDIGFGEGEEVEGDETKTFSTKIVNEPPEKFITYTTYQSSKDKELGWGNLVPTKTKSKTKSVLVFTSTSHRGNNNANKVVYLTCSMDVVEKLWESSNLKELSSYIVSYDYLQVRIGGDEEKVDNGLQFLKLIHKKREGKDAFLWVYNLQDFIEYGSRVAQWNAVMNFLLTENGKRIPLNQLTKNREELYKNVNIDGDWGV
jgi:hypothetical protein